MKNFKFKYINKGLVKTITAGLITVTLVGCGNQNNKNTPKKIDDPIIYNSTTNNNSVKKVNLEHVLALTSEKETLFVSYDNLDDTYVSDLFTKTPYILRKKPSGALHNGDRQVRYAINNYVYVYNKIYLVQSISSYIFNVTDDYTKYDTYDTLKLAFTKSNNIKEELIESTTKEMIDLKNVIVLTNGKETLYVKYIDYSKKFMTDIFTGTMYHDCNVKDALSRGYYYINDSKYSIKSIITYPYVVENIIDYKISKSILNESLIKVNENNKESKKKLTK